MDANALSARFTALCWAGWMVLWVIWAQRTKPVQRRESIASRALHGVPIAVGALLVASPLGIPVLDAPILPPSPGSALSGIWLVLTGLGFAIWARRVIARNWSGTITLKQDHELVRTGPYAIVRHPIYSGLLLALLGTLFVVDAARAVLGFAIIFAALLRKLRIEEQFMAAAFGDDYAEYRKSVPALMPRLMG